MAITIRKTKKGYGVFKDGKLYSEHEEKRKANSIAGGLRFDRDYKRYLKRSGLRRNPIERDYKRSLKRDPFKSI